MKKIIFLLIVIFSTNSVTAQINKSINVQNKHNNFIKVPIKDYSQTKKLFNKKYKVSNLEDLKNMLSGVMQGRRKGSFGRDIWDSFGMGLVFGDNYKGKGSRKEKYGKYSGGSNKYNNSKYMFGGDNSNNDDTEWTVESERRTEKNSKGEKEIYHHSIVSNDKGFTSTSTKTSTSDSDGNTVYTSKIVHEYADGTTKTSERTTTIDSDGNKHTEVNYTETDENGEVVKENHKESNEPPKEGDDDEIISPDSPYYTDTTSPPTEEEMERVVADIENGNGLLGGRRGEEADDLGEMTDPNFRQESLGHLKKKVKSGLINKDGIFPKNIDPINPGYDQRKDNNKNIKRR